MTRHREASISVEIHFGKNEENPTGLDEPLLSPVFCPCCQENVSMINNSQSTYKRVYRKFKRRKHMGAIRWKDSSQLQVINKITFDEQTELFQLHLAPDYQEWLTWEHDVAFLQNIRHRQRDRLESTVNTIEKLYIKCLLNDRKLQQDKRLKRWCLSLIMGALLIFNLFPQSVAVYMHLLNWQFSIISMILTGYLTLAMGRVFLNFLPVSWNIPLLGMSKYEKNVDDLLWNVFKLRISLKNEFDPQ